MALITQPPSAAAAAGPKGRTDAFGALGRYIVVRALLIVPTVFILVTMVFFVMHATGDPITAAQGGRLSPEELQRRIHEAGYDRSLISQYLDYLSGVVRGDFGVAISDGQPVTHIFGTYGTATAELAMYGLTIALLLGIPLGMLAAYKRDRWPDAILRVTAILWYATPVFFVGLMLKLTFSVWLNIFPVAGRADTRTELELTAMSHPSGIYILDAARLGDWSAVGTVLTYAVLPAVSLGLLIGGIFLRLVRANLIGTLNKDYIMAARSRGVRETRLVRSHALKPALIPIITVIGLQVASVLGGAVLTERTFEWKGLGYELVHYLNARDFVAVQGIVAMLAIIVAVVNFVVDVIAALIDPRVRY